MKKLVKGLIVILAVIGFISFRKEPCSGAQNITVGTFSDLKTYLSKSEEYVITLKNNITLTGKITVKGKKTIEGNGKCLYRSESFTSGYLIVLDTASQLNIKSNCHISGNSGKMVNPTKPLFRVEKDATLRLGTGVNLYNNKSENAGGAIWNNGKVYIEGANIYNCHCNTSGGAIQMQSNSKLYMSAGRIYKNSASLNGGGIHQATGAYIELTGGSIDNNSCLNLGDGIYAKGTIVLKDNGKIPKNNDFFVEKVASLTITDWKSPSAIYLRTNKGVGEILIYKGAAYSAYYAWSSKQANRETRPLCSIGSNVYVGAYYTIQYYGYGGTNLYKTQTKVYGTPIVLLSTAPSVTGHSFLGWYTSPDKGVVMTGKKYTENAGLKLYAHYSPNTYQVTYYSQGTCLKTVYVQYGKTYGTMPSPGRTGYTFTGWYTENGTKVLSSTVMNKAMHHSLYAGWKPNTYQVTLHGNGGEVGTTTKQVTYDSAYGSFPIPYRNGYDFVGWYTEKTGGTRREDTSIVTIASNHTLYARWKPCSYTVWWDPMEGEVNFTTSSVTFDMPYGTLPTASRAGYKLDGWYTKPQGGSKCTSDTLVKIAGNHTLYARWIQNKSTETSTDSKVPTSNKSNSTNSAGKVKITRIYVKGFKTYYKEKQSINTKNMKLVVVYSNNTKKTISKGWKVLCYKKTAGKRNVVFQYQGVSCKVQCIWLSKKQIASMKPDKISYSGYAGEKIPIKITSAYGNKVTAAYKSHNTKIATVSKTGIIQLKKPGTTYITITMTLGMIKKTVKVKVMVKKATLSTSYKYGKTWNKIWFKATAKGTLKTPVYISSNTKVAKINRKTGELTALATGKVTITVKAGNLQRKYRIQVNKKYQYIMIE